VVTCDEGRTYLRVWLSWKDREGGEHRGVYCHVRRSDGAIFKSVGWKGPRLSCGVLGHVDDYHPDLLAVDGPRGRRATREHRRQ
jgi:hypothetical protein